MLTPVGSRLFLAYSARQRGSTVDPARTLLVHRPVAAWYCSTMLAGTRPRSLMTMPCSLPRYVRPRCPPCWTSEERPRLGLLRGWGLRRCGKAAFVDHAPGALDMLRSEEGGLAVAPPVNAFMGGAAVRHRGGVVRHDPVNCG
jgi:hypothetical protein